MNGDVLEAMLNRKVKPEFDATNSKALINATTTSATPTVAASTRMTSSPSRPDIVGEVGVEVEAGAQVLDDVVVVVVVEVFDGVDRVLRRAFCFGVAGNAGSDNDDLRHGRLRT
jgi:hypothetical protein